MRDLRQHVEELAGSIGERNVWQFAALERAADYIEGQFRSSGYSPVLQTYDVSRLPVSNIEVVLEGTSLAGEMLVVGAHYDTVGGSPGANDNATGIAALIELARLLSGRPLARTGRFVAFVNEDPPFSQTAQMGTRADARAARARGDRIVGMLALETMGYYSDAPGSQQYPVPEMAGLYPDVGNFIGFVSNEESAELLDATSRAFANGTSFSAQAAAIPADLPGTGWSDHWSFWEAGYPALMVTDTAPWRYPWYHTADDTPDKIDYGKLAEVVNGLEHVVRALAQDRQP
ncbi:MAG: M28 family peptidase [Vicinamibacterales bacterium]